MSEVELVKINCAKAMLIINFSFKPCGICIAGILDDATASAYKIYDRVETCTNADELLPKVCPDGCGMVSVKANIPP